MNASPVHLFNIEGHYRRLKKYYNALTPEEQEFVKSQQLSAGHSTAYWQKLFQRLIVLDVVGSDLRRIFRKTRLILTILAILAVFMLPGTQYVPLMWVILVLTIWSWQRTRSCIAKDVNDNVRTGLVKVFQVLGLETRFIKLSLDVRPLDQREVASKENYGTNTKLEFYEVPLLTLSATLKDGNTLNVKVHDVICKRERKKISASGKRKTKVKFKGRRLIRVDLGLNPQRYIRRDGKLAPGSKVVTKDGQQKIVTQFKLKFDGEFKYLDAENILKTIAKAYQQTKVVNRGKAA